MRLALQYVLSTLFISQMYASMAVIAIIYLPWALVDRRGAFAACHAYCDWVMWTARWMVGLRCEIRGEAPTHEALVAAKHHSFLDILMIYSAVPRGKFIMKKELVWAPILGWYALRIGCVPVDRGRRATAIKHMMAGVAKGASEPGQLIIYPQGTRVAPGAVKPYKIGTGHLYAQLGQPCVPVATNVGLFWPRHGILRKPGLAVVEFLPEIPPGQPVEAFMVTLERQIEATSNRLMAEAGFRKGALNDLD
ncbi:MAG: lysophospholipid acyltransferase family protein [Gemmobacter sp.]|nr:lysophospholipid acyltransferase family protein [Gemmobacter sp.]